MTGESISPPKAETLSGGRSPQAIIWWGRAKVKLGRYAVRVLYAPDADLVGIFGPDAVTAITETPIYIPLPVKAPALRASDILLGRIPPTIARA